MPKDFIKEKGLFIFKKGMDGEVDINLCALEKDYNFIFCFYGSLKYDINKRFIYEWCDLGLKSGVSKDVMVSTK